MQLHSRIFIVKPWLDVPASCIATACGHPIDHHFSDIDFRHRLRGAVLGPILIVMRVVPVMVQLCGFPFCFGYFLPSETTLISAIFAGEKLRPVVDNKSPKREVPHL